MAENGQEQNCDERETENRKFPVGNHVVCLIDVLGQNEKLAEWDKHPIPSNGKPSTGLIKALKNTAGVILPIRELCTELFCKAKEYCPPEYMDSLSPSSKELLDRFHNSEIKTQYFSDTLVFYTPIENEDADVNVGRIFEMIIGACALMITMLAGKDPVRGSLCVGQGIELGEGDFYGPALSLAHRLEAKEAGHPRILVQESVTKLLTRQKRFSQHAVVEPMMRRNAVKALALLDRDKDGHRIVDYAGKGWCEHTSGAHELLLPQVEAAHAVVCAERKRFQNDPDDTKLGPRYALVEEYLTERLHLWRGDGAEA
jgi:hypothetical protein